MLEAIASRVLVEDVNEAGEMDTDMQVVGHTADGAQHTIYYDTAGQSWCAIIGICIFVSIIFHRSMVLWPLTTLIFTLRFTHHP